MPVEYATWYKYSVRQLCIKEAKWDIFLILQFFLESIGKMSFWDHTLLWWRQTKYENYHKWPNDGSTNTWLWMQIFLYGKNESEGTMGDQVQARYIHFQGKCCFAINNKRSKVEKHWTEASTDYTDICHTILFHVQHSIVLLLWLKVILPQELFPNPCHLHN